MDSLETKTEDKVSVSWPNNNPNIDIGRISTLSLSISTKAYFDFLLWAVWWRSCNSLHVHVQPLSTARHHLRWCCAAEVQQAWHLSHWYCTACKEEYCVLQVPQSHSQIQFRDSCSDSCQKWKKCTTLWNKTHHNNIMICKVLSFILMKCILSCHDISNFCLSFLRTVWDNAASGRLLHLQRKDMQRLYCDVSLWFLSRWCFE